MFCMFKNPFQSCDLIKTDQQPHFWVATYTSRNTVCGTSCRFSQQASLIRMANSTSPASLAQAHYQQERLECEKRPQRWLIVEEKKSPKKSTLCLRSKEMSESDVSESEHCDNWWWWWLPKELNSRWESLLSADQWLAKMWEEEERNNKHISRESESENKTQGAETVVITASALPSSSSSASSSFLPLVNKWASISLSHSFPTVWMSES